VHGCRFFWSIVHVYWCISEIGTTAISVVECRAVCDLWAILFFFMRLLALALQLAGHVSSA
jgi:hypothetical protein